MKYPALLPFDDLLPQLDQFDTIIDARSEGEFAEDHIPGAINCPVLNNEERARVGTLYKQVGSFEAKRVGAAIVARNISSHLETHFADKPRDWKPLVYCWRGGNRSGSMAHILAKIGWPAIQLDGGYKEYRRHVVAALEVMPRQFDFRVIAGPTGSGKSELLRTLEQEGAQVLDLEKMASHRGSVLGSIPSQPQPTQKSFESAIWHALRRFDPARPIFVESESKKVGSVRVPEALMECIRASPCIAVSLSMTDRVALLMREYVHFVADPDALNRQLDCLLPLHGRDNLQRWHEMAKSGAMQPLVEELLVRHYDPAYLRSISRNFARYTEARDISLPDISPKSFVAAARELMTQE
ncbi:tRNA 2-selenouridine synthase [Paucimonas lemoignei]|uniref:tRNA 2-selenouridine synthase n=1 Tax=Paucimonas lemoignei TaxID=29443 RepID=A0A4R3I0L4_PAULE|nr:tRNA 2-selenouridine(34) synthase MnmH [Paucimonas lemoignei]TCS39237.1 tRNA 2-selenouridine synthase [Paucimonas lemoignei]